MLTRLGLYTIVGGLSAGIHALILVLLPKLQIPVSAANLIGFLVASLWSYLAHSKVSFRQQSKGKVFPRRWLLLQLGANVVLSLLLPALFASWAKSAIATFILVFTPTGVNYVVWSLAANHVQKLHAVDQGISPHCHADDLGLDETINDAIFALADAGHLQGSSLMVAGPSVAHALTGLRSRPWLKTSLHLVLTEGPPVAPPETIPLLINQQGLLNLGFGRLLLNSILPRKFTKAFSSQLATEIKAQITTYALITGEKTISLDGHQHIHLVPSVWRELLKLEPPLRPNWLRTIREPWPTGISLTAWLQTIISGSLLKWLILSLLSIALKPSLKSKGIASNSHFAGVLFTGRMAGPTLQASFLSLSNLPINANQEGKTPPLLLVHPSGKFAGDSKAPFDAQYRLSARFYASPWRQMEYQSLAQGPSIDRSRILN